MRNTLIIINLFFFSNFLMAQSGEWRVLGGVKMSSKWQGSQAYSIIDTDVYWQIESTKPISLGTYSVIYSNKISSKLDWSVGINYNEKGFKEKGLFYDFPSATFPFENNRIRQYIGLLAGVRYNFIQKGTWKLGIETLINPETEMQGYQDVKKTAVSSMNMLNIEKAVNKHFSIVLSPFFETSLMKYNKKGVTNPLNYTPYGYGLTLGLKYRK